MSRPVYGAQHPPRHDTPQKKDNKVRTTRDAFQDFQEKTSDAWDDGDDDVVGLSVDSKLHISKSTNSSLRQRGGASVHGTAAKRGGEQKEEQNSSTADVTQNCSSVPNTPSRQHNPHRRQNLMGPGLGIGVSPRPLARPSPGQTGKLPGAADRDASKREKFASLFQTSNVDLDELRRLSWSGIVSKHRPVTWKILSGYLPPIFERHEATLERKRQEYRNYVDQYYSTRHQEIHQETHRQIQTDVPRMSPLIPLFQQDLVQEIFERILYIWSIRHPASGYVQGINDLVTPFFIVFLSEYVSSEMNVESYNVSLIAAPDLQCLEADCFWCFSKLLDGIQDNYTFAQPGIQLRINSLKELVSRIDNSLHRHLERQKVEYLQFSFRWMNNLLMRELPLRCIIRLWDTYLSEQDGFASFHLYVCAAFLTKFSPELKLERDFHGLMLMLQNLPTQNWTDTEIGLVLAEAYRLKFTFADAPKHFRNESAVHISSS